MLTNYKKQARKKIRALLKQFLEQTNVCQDRKTEEPNESLKRDNIQKRGTVPK